MPRKRVAAALAVAAGLVAALMIDAPARAAGQARAYGTVTDENKTPLADVKITITDASGRTIRTLDGPKAAGIHRVMWNLAPQPAQGQAGGGFGGGRGGGGGAVDPGTYSVTLDVAGKKFTKPLQVLQDRWLNVR